MRRDPDLLAALQARHRVLSAIREFFSSRDFMEVETPALVLAADPSLHLESFVTELHLGRGRAVPLYLPTSPEHHMKRMVVAGAGSIFQICKFFRNGESTRLHNPEFTGLEWYQTGSSLEDAMALTEQLIQQVAERALSRSWVVRRGRQLSLVAPYRRLAVREALTEMAGVEVPAEWQEAELRSALEKAGIRTAPDDGFDDLVNRALLERVEPALETLGPVFLHDYPAPMAAQARLRLDRPWEAERFELYIGGLELCNGYGELSDAGEMRKRFELARAQRKQLGKPVPPIDQSYLRALEQGLPECSGCALGVDRLLMLLLEKVAIEQVMAFPLSLDLEERH